MSAADDINRRNDTARTAGAIGVVAGDGLAPAPAEAAHPLPPGFDDQKPLIDNWNRQLNQIVEVDLQKDAPELAEPAVRERHRIYCYLLMKLIHRFWNGNKRGPHGTYPLRPLQKDVAPPPDKPQRYRGDMIDNPGGLRVNWDRYLGHNIACLAVDGNGEVMDFDFNHNDLFRSSAEHAEARMVRRLFSLTNIFDNWQTRLRRGHKPLVNAKPRAASLHDVTLYTSLESCAQCSGVMSLAGVKQIVYLQNDFTAYKIGNIMYNLANRLDVPGADGKLINIPGAPVPIPGSEVGLGEFNLLNDANREFARKIVAAGNANPPDVIGAFFVPENGKPDFDPAITSFLCTDKALKIFSDGGNKLETMTIEHKSWKPPVNVPDTSHILTNEGCRAHAQRFYEYADVEGYRGSPHKL
jgi:tRNA(Arg) A34 adenosine deaminase TadA